MTFTAFIKMSRTGAEKSTPTFGRVHLSKPIQERDKEFIREWNILKHC